MKIKICGLSRPCDVDFVNTTLPDYVGFIFAKSRRQVNLKQARLLKRQLDTKIATVGVFVNAPLDIMEKAVTENIVDILQLHGQEDDSVLEACKSRLPHTKIIKALQVHEIVPDLADYILFDAPKAGSGEVFDWSHIPKTEKAFFLAGGIGLHNIEQAMQHRPYAVDISSGAEVQGFKDKHLIEQLVRKVRHASI